MKTNKNIQDKIDAVFDSVNHIEEVKASHFFKDKTLDRLFVKKEEKQKLWSWFTPQLQLTTLACVIILNVFAFTKIKESTYNDNLNQFAESYGLSTTTETSIFN